jgi:hypothetical protein
MDAGHRIDELRAFEREYRARLRLDLENWLGRLDDPDGRTALRVAVIRVSEAPGSELQAALAEVPERQRQRLLTALLRVPVPEVTP